MGASCHANVKPIDSQAQHSQASKGGLVRRGSLLLGWLSLFPCRWLTLPFSFSHSLSLHRKLPGVAFKILPGSPEIAGAVAPAISGFSGPALGCPYGASQTHVNFFRAPDGLYFPGLRACVCVPMYLHISTRNLDVLGVFMTCPVFVGTVVTFRVYVLPFFSSTWLSPLLYFYLFQPASLYPFL